MSLLSHYFPNTMHYKIMQLVKSLQCRDVMHRGEGSVRAMNVGVVFCGRQSSGGHNVVAGLFDYLHAMNPTSKLLGFIGGTSGLFEGSCIEVTEETLRLYRNTGGYDLLGRSADKISEEDYSKVVASCTKFNLDGLVLIGGAYTATDATLLTEFLLNSGVKTRIVVVPCDYSRDLKNNFVETTVGFDTYCRTVSALIGNISTDSRSAAKYYHFIRLLGRSPSHVVLEAALQSHPNYAIISEEVAAKRLTLLQVVNKLADVICERARNGQNYGVVLIPEGLIKSISEFSFLLDEISTYVNKGIARDEIYAKLTPWSKALFDFLPPVIQQQIFNPPESRGNFQLHAISTEVMIANLVRQELQRRKEEGLYDGKFDCQTHFLGYQARTSFPSLFDCDYAYALGREVAALVQNELTGYLVTLRNLKDEPKNWVPFAVPLLACTTMEAKQGVYRPSIPESNVDMTDAPFQKFVEHRDTWAVKDDYCNPGGVQFGGAGSWNTTLSLQIEKHDYLKRIQKLRAQLKTIETICLPGCDDVLIDSAIAATEGVIGQLEIIKKRL